MSYCSSCCSCNWLSHLMDCLKVSTPDIPNQDGIDRKDDEKDDEIYHEPSIIPNSTGKKISKRPLTPKDMSLHFSENVKFALQLNKAEPLLAAQYEVVPQGGHSSVAKQPLSIKPIPLEKIISSFQVSPIQKHFELVCEENVDDKKLAHLAQSQVAKQVNDVAISFFSFSTLLQALVFSYADIQDEADELIHTALHDLFMYTENKAHKNRVINNDEDIRLNNFRWLTHLEISHIYLNDQSLTTLCHFVPNIEILHANLEHVTSKGFGELLKLKKLIVLHARNCLHISPRDLAGFSALKTLKEIALDNARAFYQDGHTPFNETTEMTSQVFTQIEQVIQDGNVVGVRIDDFVFLNHKLNSEIDLEDTFYSSKNFSIAYRPLRYTALELMKKQNKFFSK